MKNEYDVKKLKVKRRGILPGLKGQAASSVKIKITISLDKDVIDYFKSEASKSGALPYQTQINQALRKTICKDEATNDPKNVERIKKSLLSSADFINQVAKTIARKKRVGNE